MNPLLQTNCGKSWLLSSPGILSNPSTLTGSTSNPIIIDNSEKYGAEDEFGPHDSDADTEILSTPEFWAILDGESNHVLSNKAAVTDSSSRLPCKCFDCIQPFELSSTNRLPVEEDEQEAVGTTEGDVAHAPQSERHKFGAIANAPLESCGHSEPPLPRQESTYERSDIRSEPLDDVILNTFGSEFLEKSQKTLGDTYQKFFDSLTTTYIGSGSLEAVKADPENVYVHAEARGNPQNVGKELTAVRPIMRTNPVTGWKSVWAVGPFPKEINELSPDESDELLKKFYNTILENHDLQVRFKWRNPNDISIWNNRCAFHTATFDYKGLGERYGHRAVGIGEKPYLDPNSISRAETLAAGDT
ncbi:taurine dioxygenase family protein [Penicillium riverlandense]|uniref:taurine dioxygenase family protein n=1 Tax=Penicillium riverlandense TaxID=1903569 RepID=UPI0025495FDA|nr:taurine dioxygenase family protein [Penicillium riverlandense]KAJ5819462.1 taurine dioxygenase family protein [Penicillium riverlandense]